MARIRARIRPATTGPSLFPNSILRQSSCIPLFKNSYPDRRLKPLVARVPRVLSFPALPTCRRNHRVRQTRPLSRRAFGLLLQLSLSELVQRVRANAQRSGGQLLQGETLDGTPYRHLLTSSHQPNMELPRSNGAEGSSEEWRSALARPAKGASASGCGSLNCQLPLIAN